MCGVNEWRRTSGPDEPLDVRRIHYLVRLMKRYDLTALDLSDGTVQIRLRRRGAEIAPHGRRLPSPTGDRRSPAVPHRRRPPPARPAAPPSPGSPPRRSSSKARWSVHTMPRARPTLRHSSRSARSSGPSTIVCIIEAMKVFTDIPAGVSGTIAEVLVKNGQAVEFGQPLFRVTRLNVRWPGA